MGLQVLKQSVYHTLSVRIKGAISLLSVPLPEQTEKWKSFKFATH